MKKSYMLLSNAVREREFETESEDEHEADVSTRGMPRYGHSQQLRCQTSNNCQISISILT